MSPSAPPDPEQNDPIWDALGQRPETPIDPYFARRTSQIARDIPRQQSFSAWFFGSKTRQFVGGAAIASVAIMLSASPVPQPASAPSSSPAPVAMTATATIEQGVAAVDYVDYFDEILTTEDPSLLSDDDILALLVDDGSSTLLF
jgi:hypothetical protein